MLHGCIQKIVIFTKIDYVDQHDLRQSYMDKCCGPLSCKVFLFTFLTQWSLTFLSIFQWWGEGTTVNVISLLFYPDRIADGKQASSNEQLFRR
jgi:hypothetical protein